MNATTVAHRWANQDFGRNNTLTASRSCHANGRNYFSYSTVFGQWLDLEKKVVAIFDGHTSSTSSKYKLSKSDFPADVHVFPLDLKGGWNNCNVVSAYYDFEDEDFKACHRMQMIDHYVGRIYNQFAAINGGRAKGLENVNFSAWDYIEKLCSLYKKDTTIGKWIKHSVKSEWKNTDKKEDKLKRRMVRMLASGERDVKTITDAMFGAGTFDTYWAYCARYRKAEEKRKSVEMLCERLGIASPYKSYNFGGNAMESGLTVKQIRSLTAKERIELHFAAIAYKERKANEITNNKKYAKSKRNAYLFITGYEPELDNRWTNSYKRANKVRNMFTGEEYVTGGAYMWMWCKTNVDFDFDSFRKSEDKEMWIRNFYDLCKEVSDNRKAIAIMERVHANRKQFGRMSWDKGYIADEHLRENTTDDEYIVCVEFIRKQDKHFADKAARERAEAIEKARREEERRREEEYMKAVKQSEIDECMLRGTEGRRDLWRKHLTTIYAATPSSNTSGFFNGGNVLLRLNLSKTHVETSKGIRIPVEICKKMWNIVCKWHDNPSCFKPMTIDTKGSGTYEIISYRNDILTAGCHSISYTEMERMFNEIVENE